MVYHEVRVYQRYQRLRPLANSILHPLTLKPFFACKLCSCGRKCFSSALNHTVIIVTILYLNLGIFFLWAFNPLSLFSFTLHFIFCVHPFNSVIMLHILSFICTFFRSFACELQIWMVRISRHAIQPLCQNSVLKSSCKFMNTHTHTHTHPLL